jgi:hypothetical protein
MFKKKPTHLLLIVNRLQCLAVSTKTYLLIKLLFPHIVLRFANLYPSIFSPNLILFTLPAQFQVLSIAFFRELRIFHDPNQPDGTRSHSKPCSPGGQLCQTLKVLSPMAK